MNENLKELSLDELTHVAGGTTTVTVAPSSGGILSTISGWLSSSQPTSTTALNAHTGIRG